MTLEAGARLGHYRIISLLGRGGMADVYRAEDERLGREVALKAVPPEFARDPERVERFEREVRAAARLTHPNIVTVHEFGQGAGQHFYTMALMPGGDLKARIRAHPEGMPPAEARAVAAAMARALDYAHRQGFVHRDVKPENILFGEDGAPQLTDFGIARAMSSGTRMTATGMSIGSPHYMSPEQARGKEVDGRSDLYSLGVVLYEMLTGRVPFDADETLAVALSHLNDPIPQLPPALAEWQPVVDRLLAKSPDDRFGSAADLAKILASDAPPLAPATRMMPTGRDLSSPSRRQEPAPRLAAWATTRRGPLAALAGAALALAVVTIGYVALQDAAEPSAPPPPPAPQELPVLGGGALLVAETTPPGAEVLVDGELVGETPLERADIRAGVREVTLRHPHYATVRIPDRNFEDGVALRVERVLTRGAGRLTVTATPRDAWVEVDGQRLAERTPVTLEDLPAGTVQLTVGAAEHRPLTVAVDIPRDGLARLEPALEQLQAGESRVFDEMEFVWVPAGEFRMGSTSEHATDDEQPVTRVRIGEGFWLGKYEVTQSEWQRVMGSNPSRFDECGPTCPVERVSWNDAQEFIGRLSARGGGNRYRLPSEAEWEYAVRAGTTSVYWWGNEIGDNRANCDGCGSRWDGESTAPVGSFAANAWGLHDVHGNVREWVEDCWHGNYEGAPGDGSAWTSGGNCRRRVLRGGSGADVPGFLRAADRLGLDVGGRLSVVGFRVARTPD